MKKSLLVLMFSAATASVFAQGNAAKGVSNTNLAPFKQNHTPAFNVTAVNAADGDSVFYFDGNEIFGDPEYVDFNVFDLANVDLDGKQPDPAIVNGFSENLAFTFFFNPDALPDTTYWVGAYSWFAPVGAADNWFIMGPVKCPEQGGQLRWQHRMPDNQFRDGYEVYVGTGGLDPGSYSASERIFDVNDNASSTAGDTTFQTRSAFVPVALAGQDIYIAFHHNADNMFILYLDEVALVADPAAGISNSSSINMTVFPNLVNDNLFVNFGNNQSANAVLSIIDAQGRVVKTLNGNNGSNNQTAISVSDLNNGFYMLRTVINGQVRTDKFVVKH
jgi:hypothetical protein